MAPVAMSEMDAPASVASVRSLRSGAHMGRGRGVVFRMQNVYVARPYAANLPMHVRHEWPITPLHTSKGLPGDLFVEVHAPELCQRSPHLGASALRRRREGKFRPVLLLDWHKQSYLPLQDQLYV